MIDRERLRLFKCRRGVPNQTVTILHWCARAGALSQVRSRSQRRDTGTGSSNERCCPWWQLTAHDSVRCDAGHRRHDADKVARVAARDWSQVIFVAGRCTQKKPGPVNGARLEMPAWGPANLRGELAAGRRLWEDIHPPRSSRTMLGARFVSNAVARMSAMHAIACEKSAQVHRALGIAMRSR